MKEKINYRGVKPATLVCVLEGKGNTEYPYQQVQYVLGYEYVNGIPRQVTLGKLIPLSSEEKEAFDLNI